MFDDFESADFAARLNVASDFRTFLIALRESSTVREHLRELDSMDRCLEVYTRLKQLLEEDVDPEYLHPHDTPIAAYLYALSRREPEVAKAAVELVRDTDQLWWADRMATYVAEEIKHLQEASRDPSTQTKNEPPRPFFVTEQGSGSAQSSPAQQIDVGQGVFLKNDPSGHVLIQRGRREVRRWDVDTSSKRFK